MFQNARVPADHVDRRKDDLTYVGHLAHAFNALKRADEFVNPVDADALAWLDDTTEWLVRQILEVVIYHADNAALSDPPQPPTQ
jgi:hypothetical protein